MKGIEAITAKVADKEWLQKAKSAMGELAKPTVPYERLEFYKVEAGNVLIAKVLREREGTGKKGPYDFIDVEVLRTGNLETSELSEELAGKKFTVDIGGHVQMRREMEKLKPLENKVLAIGNKGVITGKGKLGAFRKYDYKVVEL